MCGIYGLVSLNDTHRLDPALLTKMAAVTVHRGPDDEGSYNDDGIALGMRRLSIIDLDHGRQPISNEDETVWVVCNGEIYNFRALRRMLESRGHVFRTGSDTEVLVHLYEEFGADLVAHLEGMYGFALWDSTRRRFILGRDRLGIKQLYFARDANRLVFASEAKAILQVPGVSAQIDDGVIHDFFTFGYSPNERSLFRGIDKLPPASLLICEAGNISVHQYWSLNGDSDERLSEQQWAEQAYEHIHQAVVAEMVSDVPLGAFLSGGIDSSAIVSIMAAHSDLPTKTYSIGFDTGKAGAFYNELPYARQVSDLFATDHKEILVRPNVAELLPKLLWHMDEPIADSAFVTTYLVAEFARQNVKVILSGVGGDELFGGYRRYLGDYYNRRYEMLPLWLRRTLVAPLVGALPSDRHSPLLNIARYMRTFVDSSGKSFEERYRSYVRVFGEQSLDRLLRGARRGEIDSLDTAFAIAADGDGLNRLMRVDLLTQLPNDLLMLTDKMTMAASLECRVPLLNHKLVEFAARIPADIRIPQQALKSVLKKALAGKLPREILHRKKRGFGAPMGAWLKAELARLIDYVLSRETIESRGVFDWRVVCETVEQHRAQKEDHTDHLLALLNFEIWARLYIDGESHEDLAGELTERALP